MLQQEVDTDQLEEYQKHGSEIYFFANLGM